MNLLLTQDPCRGPLFGMSSNGFLYQWLDGLLRETFEREGWTVTLAAPRGAGGHFDPQAVADALGLQHDPSGWARLSSIADGTPEAAVLDRVVDAQLGDPAADLLIGFELPPWLTRWASRRRIPFVCIGPASFRFLPDLLVELNTSEPALYQIATDLAVSEDALESAAACFVAAQRARDHAPLLGRGRFGLLVGQMSVDASHVTGGRLARLDEHIDSISAIAADLDAVFITPHPYEPDRSALDAVAAAIPRARVTEIGTYDLLSASSLTDVIALSSSVLAEATLFGKRAHPLVASDRSVCRAALAMPPVVLSLGDAQHALARLARQHGQQGFADAALDRRREPAAGRPGTSSLNFGTPFRDALNHRWGLDRCELPSRVQVGHVLQACHTGLPDSLVAVSRVDGWWPADGSYSWTSERRATLLLRANDCAGHVLVATLSVPFYAEEAVMVTLTAGRLSQRALVAPGGEIKLDIRITSEALLGGTLLELCVECDRLTAPPADGSEGRHLGVGLRDLTVLAQAPASPALLLQS